MKYKCEDCNYETNDKSNFNKHLNSKSHEKIIQSNQPIQKLPASPLQCIMCNKVYATNSSLTRHTNYYCKKKTHDINNVEKIKEELAHDFNEKLKQKEIEFEKEKADYKIQMLENQVKELKDFIRSGKAAPTYNISVEKFIQQSYPDAPHIAQLEDYSIIEDDEEKLIDSLIDQFQKKQLDKYFGDFIITNYKKDDPTNQSIWNSDTARLTYIIKELLANNKSSWNKDAKGEKTKNYIIKPLLEYIKELVNKYIQIYSDLTDEEHIDQLNTNEIQDYTIKGIYLTQIRSYVENKQLREDILKYLAPHFQIKHNNKLLVT